MEYKFELEEAIEGDSLDSFRAAFQASDLSCMEYHDGKGSLLHSAAARNAVKIMQFLVAMGADVNCVGGRYQCRPLTGAAFNGSLEAVRFLVEHGSGFDVSCVFANPLLAAAKSGHYKIVEYLLTTPIDRHATYRLPTGQLVNALSDAEKNRHKDVAALLRSHGCHLPVEGVDIRGGTGSQTVIRKSAEIEQSELVISYMKERFGPVDDDGLHEVLPVLEGLSITIHVICPNEEHPWYVIFTNGMSKRPMKVPAGKEDWHFAELVMHLPPEWKHPREAQADPSAWWPIQWLRQMAYYPHLNDTWLGLPATIVSSGEPPVPLGPGIKQTCLLMIPDLSILKPPLHLPDGQQVHFYTVVPLFTEERDYELRHGMKAFFKKLIECQVPMQVAPERKCFPQD